jgi:hypothetical protein
MVMAASVVGQREQGGAKKFPFSEDAKPCQQPTDTLNVTKPLDLFS